MYKKISGGNRLALLLTRRLSPAVRKTPARTSSPLIAMHQGRLVSLSLPALKLPCLPMVVTLHTKLLFGVYFEYCWTSNSFGGGWVISKNWLMPNIGTTRLGECHLGKFYDKKALVGESSFDECLFSRILFYRKSFSPNALFAESLFSWKFFLVKSNLLENVLMHADW